MKIITADYVLPISADPFSDGAVAWRDGVIEEVGPRVAILAKYSDAECVDFGAAAIMPGLVNCHSHLEITPMRGALDDTEHDFASWLLRLTAIRGKLSDDEIKAGALSGAREGAAAGVTCFGDIGRFGVAGVHALEESGLRGVVFQETEFSIDDAKAVDAGRELLRKFNTLRGSETELIQIGLSPHAPYTVSRELFRYITDAALADNIKISIHAGESREESDLMHSGKGFFAELLARFGASFESPNVSTVKYLDDIGVLRARPLLAHCVTVSNADMDAIASSGSRIAHCPKSNAKFGHGYAPFESFLDRGLITGLGSDSVASNNLCDLFEEGRFAALAARNRDGSSRFIQASEILRTATLGGAAALGLDDKVGSLEIGKQADIAVVSLASAAQQPVNDVASALVWSSSGRDVRATFVAGNQVYP